MANMKTAISIQESLFRDVDALAQKMHVPRSQLFTIAIRDFIQKNQNIELLHQLNKVYNDAPDSEEQKWQGKVRRLHRKLVTKQ